MNAVKLILVLVILIPIRAFSDPIIDTNVNDQSRAGIFPGSPWQMHASDTTEMLVARVLSVPGQYATIALAAADAEDNDIIEIQAGSYTNTGIVATWERDNITIRGVGGRAHLNADGITISNRKAIWVVDGDNITIENIEFSNASVPDENGAGIRHESGDMILRNCYFHDNQSGMQTAADPTAEILIEHCEFDHNGLGQAGQTHNIYIGNIAKFTIRYSYSHHATHGHNVKSRAAENHILYNRIMDETAGNASYHIDIPNGGLTFIIGNTIHQGQLTENPVMITYAEEGASNPIQEIYLSGNTMVNDMVHPSRESVGLRLSGTPVARVVNNILDGFDVAWRGAPVVAEGNFVYDDNYFVNRPNFDFHLTHDSPARDSAVAPGTAGGTDLTPAREYIHALDAANRLDDGHLDAGAFEFDSGATAPEAAFTTNPATAAGTPPLRVQFTDTSMGMPTSRQWDCDGDGNPDYSGPTAEHTYTSTGDYTVTLTVTNAAGTDTAIRTIRVSAGTSNPGNSSSGLSGGGGGGGCFIQSIHMAKVEG